MKWSERLSRVRQAPAQVQTEALAPGAPPSAEVEAPIRADWSSVLTLAVVCAILAAGILTALNFGEAARQLPLLVGIPTLALALAALVRDIVRVRRQAAASAGRGTVSEPPAAERADAGTGVADEADTGASAKKVFAVFAALVVCYLLLGFPWGGALFLFGFLLIVGKVGLVRSALVTAGVILPFYLVFVEWLNIPNFTGVLLP